MITMNENAWNEQDDLQNKPGYRYENDVTLNGTRNSAVDPDDDDDLDDEDLDDDDLDYDDEDFDDDDLDDDDLNDDDDDLDADDDGYQRVGGTTASNLSSGVANSYDNDDDLPSETPEEGEAHTEKESYSDRTEIEQQDKGDEASYSERNDVTPPNQHEFPSTGTHTETDFASRPLGRTTGRMLGHEPGTEGGPL